MLTLKLCPVFSRIEQMGGVLNSWDSIPSPPPPPPSPSSNSNLPMLYYGLVVVGTAAIVLVMYNLVVVRWCTGQPLQSQTVTARASRFVIGMRRGQGLEIRNRNLLSSFKYKKEGGVKTEEQQDRVEYECSVCLSVFEEGEEVRILPRCNHSFHAACIDMWLYSHRDCPLCRAPVTPLCHRIQVRDNTTESSQEGLMEPVNAV